VSTSRHQSEGHRPPETLQRLAGQDRDAPACRAWVRRRPEHTCRRHPGLPLQQLQQDSDFNPLMPNDPYRGRTATLTSKVSFYIFIQQIYVLNILNMVYSVRFFLFKMQFVS